MSAVGVLFNATLENISPSRRCQSDGALTITCKVEHVRAALHAVYHTHSYGMSQRTPDWVTLTTAGTPPPLPHRRYTTSSIPSAVHHLHCPTTADSTISRGILPPVLFHQHTTTNTPCPVSWCHYSTIGVYRLRHVVHFSSLTTGRVHRVVLATARDTPICL